MISGHIICGASNQLVKFARQPGSVVYVTVNVKV
jgi:hypothetical protein